MNVGRWMKITMTILALVCLCTWALPMEAWARVGGGGSSGSRGSRSASPPKSYTAPTQPSRPSPSPGVRPQPTSQPSSFMRNLGAGLLGGFLGGMLFRGMGFGGFGGGGFGGGISLIDILLLAGIAYLIYRIVKRKRVAATTEGYQSSTAETTYQTTYPPAYDQPLAPEGDRDLEQGLAHIKQYDPAFAEAQFQDRCMDTFFKIQGAWANRDMSEVRNLLTDEMYRIFQGDAERLKSEGKINRLENIAVRSVDITEAWQEAGADYVTVRVYANILDYTVEEVSGKVLEGSKTDPVKFEEYWTFTRPVGNNPWKLSAIQQPA
jgi:predicted lipid-binding transport protein (Tim44 family)